MLFRKKDAALSRNYSEQIEKLKQEIKIADAIVIGAGAGLSASAGLVYTGERLEKYFGDFVSRYHFRDMYSGGFYPYDTLEEHWAYWSRYIYINRYMDARDLINSVCSIRKEITVCFSAVCHAIWKLMTMQRLSVK